MELGVVPDSGRAGKGAVDGICSPLMCRSLPAGKQDQRASPGVSLASLCPFFSCSVFTHIFQALPSPLPVVTQTFQAYHPPEQAHN